MKDCPWDFLREWSGSPNVKWCEESLCRFIEEPANTWSNLLYILVGFCLIKNYQTLKLLSYSALFVGVSSFFYHMTNSAFSQYMDFLGMFFFFGCILSYNFARLKKLKRNTFLFILTLFNILYYIFWTLSIPVQLIIGVSILVMFLTEFLIYKKRDEVLEYKNYWIATGFLSCGAFFSASDLKRLYCVPENHYFQGHALWHVLGAISMIFIFKFYLQTSKELEKYGY